MGKPGKAPRAGAAFSGLNFGNLPESSRLLSRQRHIVPMDDLVGPLEAEQRLNVLRRAAGHLRRVDGVIGDEPPPDLAALMVADHDAVAAREGALDAGD